MSKVLCPKCGNVANGGPGFWGHSKPYCLSCGWNLEFARETERASLKQLPWSLLLLAAFFIFIGFLSKSGFALLPFLFLCVFLVGGAIMSWRKLRLIEASHPAVAYTTVLPAAPPAEEVSRQTHINADRHLWALIKPRRVRLKPIARVIVVALPISWIFIAYFGYQMIRNEVVVASPLAMLRDIGVFLLFALIWSAIGIKTARTAMRDRKLLADGEFTRGVVTHQEAIGGKHRRSQICYQFRDLAGRLVQGKGTDESWEFYEDMQVPVFYNAQDPDENVALCATSCALIKN